MIPISDDVRTRHFPIVTILLILVNSAIFFIEVLLGPHADQMIRTFGFTPAQIVTAWYNPLVPLTLITAMYLHGGWAHLIGNMLYLWIFGNNVEDRMGPVRFFLFYTLSGILAGLAETLAAPTSMTPGIGASGAIAGVLGAYLLLYPRARVQVLLPLPFWFMTFSVPAILVLGGWFVMQLFNGLIALDVTAQTGGVAWWAHIGGFVAGMLLLPLFRQKRLSAYSYDDRSYYDRYDGHPW